MIWHCRADGVTDSGFIAGILSLAYVFYLPDSNYEKEVKNIAKPNSLFLEIGENEVVHYVDTGNKSSKAIIFLHGANMSSDVWRKWSVLLSSKFRVIAIDLPNHGLTVNQRGYLRYEEMSDFLDRFTNKIGVKEFSIAGSSLGGGVALKYTIDHADKVEKLVLVSAAGINPSAYISSEFSTFSTLLEYSFFRFFIRNFYSRTAAKGGLSKFFHNNELVTGDFLENSKNLLTLPGHRDAFIDRMRLKDRNISTHQVSSIKTPTLILWGKEDDILSSEMAELYSKLIKGSTFKLYDEVGHLPMLENPVKSGQDLLSFLLSRP